MLTVKQVLRIIRVQNGETQADMSKKLGMSMSYLSQVENEHRQMPLGFTKQIESLYNPSKKALDVLKEYESNQKLKVAYIKFNELTKPQRKAALLFTKHIKEIPDDMVEFISNIIINNSSANGSEYDD